VEVDQLPQETNQVLDHIYLKVKTTKVLATQVRQLKETKITSAEALTWIQWSTLRIKMYDEALKKGKSWNHSAEES
jgi:hypothetical protein